MTKKESYDIKKAIDNIRRIMVEKDVGQKEIESITGVTQSNISNILNKKKNSSGSYKFFSVEQLVALSLEWEISVDELLGITLPKKKEENELAAILTRLFEIDELLPVDIGTCHDGHTQNICLYFNNDYLSELLKTWNSLNQFGASSFEAIGASIEAKHYWQESVISQSSSRPIQWAFRTAHEQSEYIALQYIDYYQKKGDSLNIEDCFIYCVLEAVDSLYYESVEEMIEEQRKLLEHYVGSSSYLNLSHDKRRILDEFCELQKIDQFFN